jgi:hypothetical protein
MGDNAQEQESDIDRQYLMQLHLAEYQAITSRITNWITLQYWTPAIVGGVLAVLAGVSKVFPPIVDIWTVSLIIEIGIGAYYYTLFEMMNNARYLECELAPKIRRALSAPGQSAQGAFWSYEGYRKGNYVYSPLGMYLMALPCMAIPVVAILLHRQLWPPLWWPGDLAGLTVCYAVAVLDFIIAKKSTEQQKALWSCS